MYVFPKEGLSQTYCKDIGISKINQPNLIFYRYYAINCVFGAYSSSVRWIHAEHIVVLVQHFSSFHGNLRLPCSQTKSSEQNLLNPNNIVVKFSSILKCRLIANNCVRPAFSFFFFPSLCLFICHVLPLAPPKDSLSFVIIHVYFNRRNFGLLLSVPKFSANLYCICFTVSDVLEICGKFWDTQYNFVLDPWRVL